MSMFKMSDPPMSFGRCVADVGRELKQHGYVEARHLAATYARNLGWDASKIMEAVMEEPDASRAALERGHG